MGTNHTYLGVGGRVRLKFGCLMMESQHLVLVSLQPIDDNLEKNLLCFVDISLK